MKSLISLTLTISLALTGLLLFAGTGMAGTVGPAGDMQYNGITDFTGRSYDALVIGLASGNDISDPVYESSAPGSRRLVEGNTAANFYDTFDIGDRGQAKPVMKRNWAGLQSSVHIYDIGIK